MTKSSELKFHSVGQLLVLYMLFGSIAIECLYLTSCLLVLYLTGCSLAANPFLDFPPRCVGLLQQLVQNELSTINNANVSGKNKRSPRCAQFRCLARACINLVSMCWGWRAARRAVHSCSAAAGLMTPVNDPESANGPLHAAGK